MAEKSKKQTGAKGSAKGKTPLRPSFGGANYDKKGGFKKEPQNSKKPKVLID